MKDFLDFYNELDSVEKDHLYFTLLELMEDDSYLLKLEDDLIDIKLKIEKINKQREEESNQISKLNKIKSLIKYNKSTEISFLDFIISHKIDQLRYSIDDTKPTELLKKKFLLNNEIKYIKMKREFLSKLFEYLKNNLLQK